MFFILDPQYSCHNGIQFIEADSEILAQHRGSCQSGEMLEMW